MSNVTKEINICEEEMEKLKVQLDEVHKLQRDLDRYAMGKWKSWYEYSDEFNQKIKALNKLEQEIIDTIAECGKHLADLREQRRQIKGDYIHFVDDIDILDIIEKNGFIVGIKL